MPIRGPISIIASILGIGHGIAYSKQYINMVVNGVTVKATSEWIFSDTNYYHLTINNGYFQSLYALVNFNSSYESSLTLNRLTSV